MNKRYITHMYSTRRPTYLEAIGSTFLSELVSERLLHVLTANCDSDSPTDKRLQSSIKCITLGIRLPYGLNRECHDAGSVSVQLSTVNCAYNSIKAIRSMSARCDWLIGSCQALYGAVRTACTPPYDDSSVSAQLLRVSVTITRRCGVRNTRPAFN